MRGKIGGRPGEAWCCRNCEAFDTRRGASENEVGYGKGQRKAQKDIAGHKRHNCLSRVQMPATVE